MGKRKGVQENHTKVNMKRELQQNNMDNIENRTNKPEIRYLDNGRKKAPHQDCNTTN